jgi:hypothetical protein
MPVGLTVAAAACGFANFNWQQKVTFLPVPSPPAFAESAPNIPLTAPPPYNDPPPGGYTYQAQDPGLNFTPNQAYPFYYDTNASVSYPLSLGANIKNNGHTLLFYDAPADPCLPGGSPSLVAQYCGGATAPPGSYIRFTTALVGVLQGNTLGPVLYTWDWKDSFNGTSGGIPVIDNYRQVDPGSGTGGITITSINGVTQTPPSVSCAATPNTLWPPNGKLAEVILSGTITPGTQPIPAFGTTYVVTDEYGQFQPSGNISLSAGGSYSLGVSLIAERNGQDLDGRAYTVTVIAADGIGNVGSCSAVVTVPHDKSR